MTTPTMDKMLKAYVDAASSLSVVEREGASVSM